MSAIFSQVLAFLSLQATLYECRINTCHVLNNGTHTTLSTSAVNVVGRQQTFDHSDLFPDIKKEALVCYVVSANEIRRSSTGCDEQLLSGPIDQLIMFLLNRFIFTGDV